MEWGSQEFVVLLRSTLHRRRWFLRLPADQREDVIQGTLATLIEKKPLGVKNHLAYAVRTAQRGANALMRAPLVEQDDSTDDAPDPEQHASAREALIRLPKQQQEVVRLVLQDGLRISEVAERLNVMENTVRKRLS